MIMHNNVDPNLALQGRAQVLVHLEAYRIEHIGCNDTPPFCLVCFQDVDGCLCDLPMLAPLDVAIIKLQQAVHRNQDDEWK
jgi:hypothetical protein